jgi:hypothetical protein
MSKRRFRMVRSVSKGLFFDGIFEGNASVDVVCPGCGVKCQIGYLTVDGQDSDNPAMAHPLPQCDFFIESGTVDILLDIILGTRPAKAKELE